MFNKIEPSEFSSDCIKTTQEYFVVFKANDRFALISFALEFWCKMTEIYATRTLGSGTRRAQSRKAVFVRYCLKGREA